MFFIGQYAPQHWFESPGEVRAISASGVASNAITNSPTHVARNFCIGRSLPRESNDASDINGILISYVNSVSGCMLEPEANMLTTFGTVLFVIGIVALRMLYMNPAWLMLPKSLQRWLFDASSSPFRTKAS